MSETFERLARQFTPGTVQEMSPLEDESYPTYAIYLEGVDAAEDLADRLEQAERADADRAKVKRVEALADVYAQHKGWRLERIAGAIRDALNPDATGGEEARAMLDQVQREAQADLTRIHNTIRPGFVGGTDE